MMLIRQREIVNNELRSNDDTILTRVLLISSSQERPRVCKNVLEAIGMTPLVKLNHIPQSLGIKCQMCKLVYAC